MTAAETVVVYSSDHGDMIGEHRPPADDGSAASEADLRALAAQQRTIRRGPWKLTVDEGGEHELYDLSADPGETRNRLAPGRIDGAARAAAAPLWERPVAWQGRTADDLRLPAPV